MEVGVRHLAIQTADHDLAFGDFEGTIQPGEYGAGGIAIWDHGYYREDKWDDEVIAVTLTGTIVCGRYTLVRFPRAGNRAWLLFKGTH